MSKDGHGFNDLLLRGVTSKFTGYHSLHTGLDGDVDDPLLLFNFVGGNQEYDPILAFECVVKLIFRVGFVNGEDLNV